MIQIVIVKSKIDEQALFGKIEILLASKLVSVVIVLLTKPTRL